MSVVKLPSKRRDVRPVHAAVNELNDIALARGKQRHLVTAIIEAKRAIAVEPQSKELWSNLATFLWNARQYDEAMACVDRALSIDPEFTKAFHNKALILDCIGDHASAEAWFEKALTADSEYHNVRWCRSMMRLSLGDYERGFAEYESRIPFSRNEGKNNYPIFPAPYWDGRTSLEGKDVFCCIEQGIGDTILFSRFLPWLKEQVGPASTVHLCCAHEVMVLLWEFKLAGLVEFVPEGTPIPHCDFTIVTGSLPYFAKVKLDTIPADPGLIRKRADVQLRIGKADIPAPLGPNGYKVGLVWSGNPRQERNDERSLPLEKLLTLAEHPNVWLYSLQVGPAQADIERLSAQDLVCDLGPQLKDRGLTVATTAILQMDLVITCCTSIAHLCGALGVEAWVVLCENPYWLWMKERADSPWYPSLKLYRQDKTDDWTLVLSRVRDDLIDRVDARLKPSQTESAHG
jgi:tetratricopeptide (TPR) repeat protein